MDSLFPRLIYATATWSQPSWMTFTLKQLYVDLCIFATLAPPKKKEAVCRIRKLSSVQPLSELQTKKIK